MPNILNKIEVHPIHKYLQIREIKENGGYHRRILPPDADVSSEVQEIQDKAAEIWTDEVKSAWTTYQTEQEA